MPNNPIPPPVRPGDLTNVSLSELLDAYQSHAGRLVAARHHIGQQGTGRLRTAALDALVTGQALADRILAQRWVTVAEALTYGAPLAHVAAAMGLEPDEVAAGLLSWAYGQLRLNEDTSGVLGITPAEHAEVLALLGEGR